VNRESLAGSQADSEKDAGLSGPPILQQKVEINKVLATVRLLGFICCASKIHAYNTLILSLVYIDFYQVFVLIDFT
jgi:hypothetical protein